jgi:hypothetical protein
MKQFTKRVSFISIIIVACSGQVFAFGAKRPSIPNPAPPPAPVILPTTLSGPYLDQIKELATSSACSSYSWKNRGRAPAGYVKGVAISFARSLCRMNSYVHAPSALALIMGGADSHNDQKDALTHYSRNFLNLPIPLNASGVDPLRAVYVLGMGLGMRESSGVYCEGWDVSAGSNRPSSGAEAGLFQTSYDSMGSSPELAKLYSEYKLSSSSRCLLDVFKEGASCRSSTTLGTGAGADYQVFNKACPTFATEYAMTMLRVQRSHYGPINRLEAEVIPACNQLLLKVQELVNRDPQGACQDIF